MQYVPAIIIIVLAQVLILGRIHLFGVATPLMYVYAVMLFPRNTPRWVPPVVSFIIGIIADTFGNTPGLTAATLTLTGMLQPIILELFLSREDDDNFKPSLHNLGLMRYMAYALLLTTIFSVTFFSLDAFTFAHWIEWLLNVITSLMITMILVLTIEAIRR